KDEDLSFSIYIHETHKNSLRPVKRYWSSVTGFSLTKFDKIYFKHNTFNNYRKNRGIDYKGQLRVRVLKSTNLNRTIAAWILGIGNQCGVV
ncbi:MAG: hypothetical protein Q7S79_03130, partial [bacterium]|nr:hypothetical protein [bacterium]